MSRNFRRLTGAALAATLLVTCAAIAGVWDTFNYQGILLDSEGQRVEGWKNITFSVWDEETDGSMFWDETHILDIDNGVVTVDLGSQESLSGLSGADQYWLQIQVFGDEPMPRIKMSAVPYAFNARTVMGRSLGNTAQNIPINNGLINVGLNADKVDSLDVGHGALQIPISDGELNDALNADLLDGLDADAFALVSHGHSAVTISDEPGVSSDAGSDAVVVDADTNSLAVDTLAAPAAGYALVLATAEFAMYNTVGAASLTVGVTDTEGILAAGSDLVWAVPDTVAEFEHRQIITVQRVFSVAPGENVFYFVAYANDGNVVAEAVDRRLSVVFLPSAYGTVE